MRNPLHIRDKTFLRLLAKIMSVAVAVGLTSICMAGHYEAFYEETGVVTVTDMLGGVTHYNYSTSGAWPAAKIRGSYGISAPGVPSGPTMGVPTVSVVSEGQLVVHMTWTPDNSIDFSKPPAAAVVVETAAADWTGATGDCDDGLPGQNHNSSSGPNGGSESATYVWIKESPGLSFPIYRSPSASATVGANTVTPTAHVSWTAHAIAVNVKLSNCKPIDWDTNILIGQGTTGTITSDDPRVTFDQWNWTVPGEHFKRFEVAPDQSYGKVVPVPAADFVSSSPAWYWKESTNGSVTVSCDARVIYNGVPLATLSLWRAIQVDEPSDYGLAPFPSGESWMGPVMGLTGVIAGTSDVQGIRFAGWVTTPPLYVEWPAGDWGNWYTAQLYTQHRQITYVAAFSLYGTPYTITYMCPARSLDNQFPYGGPYGADGDVEYWTDDGLEDSPAQSLADTSLVQTIGFNINDEFEMFQLYVPPGGNSTYVPLRSRSWKWNAWSSRVAFTVWPTTVMGTGPVSTGSNSDPDHPEWTNRYGNVE